MLCGVGPRDADAFQDKVVRPLHVTLHVHESGGRSAGVRVEHPKFVGARGQAQLRSADGEGRAQGFFARGKAEGPLLPSTSERSVEDQGAADVVDREHQTAGWIGLGLDGFTGRVHQSSRQGEHLAVDQPGAVKGANFEAHVEVLGAFCRGHRAKGHGHQHGQQEEGQHPALTLVHGA